MLIATDDCFGELQDMTLPECQVCKEHLRCGMAMGRELLIKPLYKQDPEIYVDRRFGNLIGVSAKLLKRGLGGD